MRAPADFILVRIAQCCTNAFTERLPRSEDLVILAFSRSCEYLGKVIYLTCKRHLYSSISETCLISWNKPPRSEIVISRVIMLNSKISHGSYCQIHCKTVPGKCSPRINGDMLEECQNQLEKRLVQRAGLLFQNY